MKKIKCLTMVTMGLLAVTSAAFAEKVGNGGDAYQVGNILYSLDLVEAGLEKAPYFESRIAADSEAVRLFEMSIEVSPGAKLFGKKMAEIRGQSDGLYRVLMEVMRSFQFVLVSVPLRDVNDVMSQLSLDPQHLVQAAIRFDRRIQIHRDSWNKMSSSNQVALLFHELFYAFQAPEWWPEVNLTGSKCERFDIYYTPFAVHRVLSNSDQTRQVVGRIFDPRVASLKGQSFKEKLGEVFPVIKDIDDQASVSLSFQSLVDKVLKQAGDVFPAVAQCVGLKDQLITAFERTGKTQIEISIKQSQP